MYNYCIFCSFLGRTYHETVFVLAVSQKSSYKKIYYIHIIIYITIFIIIIINNIYIYIYIYITGQENNDSNYLILYIYIANTSEQCVPIYI